MKKFILSIVGFLFFLLLSPLAHAQTPPVGPPDCRGDVYSDRYTCRSESVVPFCTSWISSTFGIYGPAYCEGIKDTDDKIYKIVAQQFEISDEDVIKKILRGEPLNANDKEKLPSSIFEYYDVSRTEGGSELSLTPLYLDVLEAYEKEKVIYQMQKSFKREFEANEEWFNATLLDSPMDLIVDLNLIDTMIFGSQAQWNNDVFRFPGGDDEEEEGGDEEEEPEEETESDTETSAEDGAGASGGTEMPDDATEEPECVPENSPEAEPRSPGEIPPNCGNNILNPREQCDDGNNRSGDGCSNSCQLEDIGSLLCRDHEAVTFRDFEPSENAAGRAGENPTDEPSNSGGSECPPGSRPRRDVGRQELRRNEPPLLPQSPLYPGPLKGGVLKEFPLSLEPACPPGHSELQLQFANAGSGTTDTLDHIPQTDIAIPRCIRTEFCKDLDAARDILVPNWRNDGTLFKIATSIEALFCVNFQEANRPETPYALNEGCIDCHIRAMVKELEELLEYNIAPLENPRNAFGISNRWGPSIAFDLNTEIAGTVDYSDLESTLKDIKKENEAEKKRLQEKSKKLDPNMATAQPDVERFAEVERLLSEFNEFNSKQDQNYFEGLKNNRLNAVANQTSAFSAAIKPLLLEWQNSFARIQDAYLQIIQANKFGEIPQCR